MKDFRKAILQGEIMMLLHDIGKLHWRFVGDAAGVEGAPKNKWGLSAAHTLAYLWDVDNDTLAKKIEKVYKDDTDLQETKDLPSLQQALLTRVSWLKDSTGSLSCLGALLALHHYAAGLGSQIYTWLRNRCLQMDQGSSYAEHPAVYSAMYADTSDSRFSKGNETKEETKQNKGNIHLAYPLGGVECEITEKGVETDAENLAKELSAWAKNAAAWDEEALLAKRKELRRILETYGKRNLAETRLPNNDVSLWQHSDSAAALFKALLASYMLKGSWDGILENGGLSHVTQHLALVAVRFDDAAYVARSVRSFEIVGKRARLHALSNALKAFVEEELCIGNEIYRDSQGICFLVPDLTRKDANKDEQEMFAHLCAGVAQLCNGGMFCGELLWKLELTSTGLRLTDMLAVWKKPYDALSSCMPNANADLWRAMWEGTRSKQICPRCGLRPMPFTASRTGGEGKKNCCDLCQKIREDGAKILWALRNGVPTAFSDFGREAFGLSKIPDIPDFWNMLKQDEEDDGTSDGALADTRLALVQGVIPLAPLYDSSLFDALLSPLPEGYTWEKLESEVRVAWSKIRVADIHGADGKDTGTVFDVLFGKKFCDGKKDGWCCDAEAQHWQRRWIENLIFDGHVEEPSSAEEERAQARTIIRWALRRHPAPSRMTRVWEQTRSFMRKAFQIADSKHIPFVPLTCDAGTFQILLPSQEALGFMRSVAAEYERSFGRVRHILPLHLSAAVFYHKAPLYIAMDAARRFRRLADNCCEEWWTLEQKEWSKKNDVAELLWKSADGRSVLWKIPASLPDNRSDPYHTWFVNQANEAVALRDLTVGAAYLVRPSTFDFEVLDASTRRYDIHYEKKRRPHFMMPKAAGPRPYPLEELQRWKTFEYLFDGKHTSKLKNALELVARLHMDWRMERESAIFRAMLGDILLNSLGGSDGFDLSENRRAALLEAAFDGTLFDLFEWYDFLASPVTGENA